MKKLEYKTYINNSFLMHIAVIAIAITGFSACAPTDAPKENATEKFVEVRTRTRTADSVIYHPYKPFKTRLVKSVGDFSLDDQPEFSRYGGLKSMRREATGYFRVEKIDDRWWAIDPEGYIYLHIAVNSVNTGKSERNKKALEEKFGDKDGWIESTHNTIRDLGFNGTGSWSDTDAIIKGNENSENPLAYTINWNFMGAYGDKRGGTYAVPGHKAYPGGAIFVFDPEFEEFCNEHAKKLLAYKDDPNLFGYFSDNEMPLNTGNLEGYLTLPEDDPGHIAAKEWLDAKNITQEEITDDHRIEFLTVVADKYFSIVSKAIKKYDPNHMYLGCRFYAGEKHIEEFMKVAGNYLDIVTMNYYNQWTPSEKHLREWEEWTGRPFMITEFYTKAEDSGLPNTSGAGWIVKTQEDRGKAYENYCLKLLESKSCVGWHWFKYQDNDPQMEGAELSNIDANKGLVDNYYNVYTDMTDRMKLLNKNSYKLIEHFDNVNNDSQETD